jgi:hypothetical protein
MLRLFHAARRAKWLFAVTLILVATFAAAQPIRVTIAAINDLHGNLEAPTESVTFGGASVRAGGFTRVATLAGRLRARSPNFAFVSAGDLFGASPLLPASFDEEPVIEAMNLAGLDFNGVGNHEFDRGAEHLGRMQKGGCPAAGCRSGAQFGGARFGMLAANVIAVDTGRPLLPAYGIREYGRVKVAFIGVTLKETPVMLSPAARAGLEFRDEVETVNALVPELRRQGIEAIVVLLHQGGVTGRRRERVRRSGGTGNRHRAPPGSRRGRRRERAHAPRVRLQYRREARDERGLVRQVSHRDRSLHRSRVARRGVRRGGESLRSLPTFRRCRAGCASCALRGRLRTAWSASSDGSVHRFRAA